MKIMERFIVKDGIKGTYDVVDTDKGFPLATSLSLSEAYQYAAFLNQNGSK